MSGLSIAEYLFLILPGFLAYRSALTRSSDPSSRGTLWHLSAMIEYSVYIHALGVALMIIVTALLDIALKLETHLDELPAKGLLGFWADYFVEGSLVYTFYLLYMIVAAVLIGAYEVPSTIATRISECFGWVAGLVGKALRLNWVRPPKPNFPQEPVWHYAFHVATGGSSRAQPLVFAKMKTGDTYYGKILMYPMLPDSQKNKDFLIEQAIYAPADMPDKVFQLEQHPGGGSVLLNSADVDSIQIYYDSAVLT